MINEREVQTLFVKVWNNISSNISHSIVVSQSLKLFTRSKIIWHWPISSLCVTKITAMIFCLPLDFYSWADRMSAGEIIASKYSSSLTQRHTSTCQQPHSLIVSYRSSIMFTASSSFVFLKQTQRSKHVDWDNKVNGTSKIFTHKMRSGDNLISHLIWFNAINFISLTVDTRPMTMTGDVRIKQGPSLSPALSQHCLGQNSIKTS